MIPFFCRLLFTILFAGSFAIASAQSVLPIKIEQLVKIYQSAKGPTIVNFWSTWCKPCIEEIPHFVALADSLKKQGVQLMLVSMDAEEIQKNGSLKNFLQKKKWKARFFWLNESDADHYCPLVDKSWSGVIPVTLVINPQKNYSRFYEKELNKPALAAAVKEAL